MASWERAKREYEAACLEMARLGKANRRGSRAYREANSRAFKAEQEMKQAEK